MDMQDGVQTTSEKLIRDVRTVVQDAEDLIKATSGEVGDRTREARAKLAGALVVARESCNRLEDNVREGARIATNVVRKHPFQAVGIALAVGLVVGLIVNRD
jgi:ElaB/YqjD/DUF883 family membrane-anchored ribosome-binding protein